MKDTHPSLASNVHAEAALEAFMAGLGAVDPTVLVRRAVRQGYLDDWFENREKPKWIHVLALGKAAPRMVWGLVEASVPFRGFGVAPKGVPAPLVDTFTWLQGDHPVPGPQSFEAGRRLLEWVGAFPAREPLLVLLSGGASACVEAAVEGLADDALAGRWQEWLRAGSPIEEMNRQRADLSRLKGGRLGGLLLERTGRIRVWLLADTDPTTAPQTVGSAPLFQEDAPDRIPHRVLASNHEMVAAAGLRLASLGYSVHRFPERVHGDAQAEAAAFVAAFHSLSGEGPVAMVGGGEPVVAIPRNAPPGGRCHHAALAAARHLRDGEVFLAAASDGVDGSAKATGAWSTAREWRPEAESALRAFGSYRHLESRDRSFDLGATGTNVNDLWVALRGT